jgi:hypothetical protein
MNMYQVKGYHNGTLYYLTLIQAKMKPHDIILFNISIVMLNIILIFVISY